MYRKSLTWEAPPGVTPCPQLISTSELPLPLLPSRFRSDLADDAPCPRPRASVLVPVCEVRSKRLAVLGEEVLRALPA